MNVLDVCVGYDCNHGNCFVDDGGEPKCDCKDDWEGENCDIPKYF